MASYSVVPWDQQPGRPGTETAKPSSDFCKAIRYFIAILFVQIEFARRGLATPCLRANLKTVYVSSQCMYPLDDSPGQAPILTTVLLRG
jgi:hypothetical protein